jgi:hypothetical protein
MALEVMTGAPVDDYQFYDPSKVRLNDQAAEVSQQQIWDQIISAARTGEPIILASRRDLRRPIFNPKKIFPLHAYSVVGVDGDVLYIRNPKDGRIVPMDQAKFFKQFFRADIARTGPVAPVDKPSAPGRRGFPS